MKKTIIFDFDGTLADTFPLIIDVTYKLSRAPRLPKSELYKLRQLPVLKAMQKLGIPRKSLLWFGWRIRPGMHARMQEAPVFSGISEMLKQLHDSGYKLLVLSSNRKRNVRAFLRQNELDQYFEDIASVLYGNAFFKKWGLEKLLRKLHLQAQNCMYVGNEVLDVEAAQRVGLAAVAVTWSGHDREELAWANPNAIINKPAELAEMVKE
jgi:phosphoglycolate phosphatase